jgi:hypothetical protein
MDVEREDPKLYDGVPRGNWVALSSDGKRVVAHAVELMDAIQEAKRLGESEPIAARVPEFDSFIFL